MVPVPEARLGEVNAIYASLAFVPAEAGRDEAYWVLESDRPVALGRLDRHPDGALEASGFWVHPAHRGRGLARRVVGEVLRRAPAGRTVWCVPFDPLVPFYASFGWTPPGASEEVPASIRAKLAACRATCRADRRPTTALRLETPPGAGTAPGQGYPVRPK